MLQRCLLSLVLIFSALFTSVLAQDDSLRQLVFVSQTDGHYHIFLMNSDGSGLEQLTEDDEYEYTQPEWSPDGSQIAFTRSLLDEYGYVQVAEVMLMDADGGNQHSITSEFRENNFDTSSPSWSHDGQWIAFDYVMTSPGTLSGDGGFYTSGVYRLQAPDFEIESIPEHGLGDLGCWSPQWTMDDRIITSCQGLSSTWLTISDDGNQANTERLLQDGSPRILDMSPFGNFIAVRDDLSLARIAYLDQIGTIHTIRADVFNDPDYIRIRVMGMAWSPLVENEALVYTNHYLYLMHINGDEIETSIVTEDIPTATNIWGTVPMDWSNDGEQILFSIKGDEQRELYVINPDGSGLLRLTDNDHDDFGAQWRP